MSAQLKPLLVDICVPYCIRKERYQSRYQLIGSNEEKNAYLAAVKRELLSYADSLDGYEVRALRLSGGSATVMSPDLLGDLLKTARQVLPVARGAEFSVDAHPLTIGTPALTGIASGHPNRFELMMRSENEPELRELGCVHTMQHINNAMLFFGKFHVNNVGITVNLGIPGQSESSWHNTLHACTILSPAHISVLPLDVTDADGMPDQAARASMYRHACEYLTDNGYLQYAARHFCLPQHASIFELLQMDGAERIGLGLGNITEFDGYLTRNTNNPGIYLSCAGDFEKTTAQVFTVDQDYHMKEYVQNRCNSTDGLDLDVFQEKFGQQIPVDIFRTLEEQAEKGELERDGQTFRPTVEGLFRRL